MVKNESKEMLVKFERKGKLLCDLPNTIDELQEDWGPIIVVVFVFAMTYSVGELVTETQPLFFYQYLKSFQSPRKQRKNC